MMHRGWPMLTSGLALAVAFSAPAFGQIAGTGDSAPVRPKGAGIENITVTAQKRPQTAQKTALSIAVITGKQIADQAKNTISEVLRDVPAVKVQSLAQGAQIFIRGVGSSIDPGFADPAVSLMIDGSYDGRTESLGSGSFDIDRVEVLRGPQGTLYGRNASGGAVNVLTTSPTFGKFFGDVRGEAGDYGEWRTEGAVNVPILDNMALRIAGFREKHDSYIVGGGDDTNDWGYRAKLRYDPVDWVDLLFKVEGSEQSGYGANTVSVPGSAGNLTFPPPIFFTNFNPALTPPFTGGVPIPRFPNGWPNYNPNTPFSTDPYHPGGLQDNHSLTYQLLASFKLGDIGTLTVQPSYTKDKRDLVSSFLFGTLTGPYAGQTGISTYKSIEARLASPADNLIRYIAGFYYLRSSGSGIGGTQTIDVDELTQNAFPSDTIAGFGQVTYNVTKTFRLVGGVRYSVDDVSQDFQITGPGYNTGLTSYSKSQDSFTYLGGIEWDFRPASMFYAHVSTGFKQGGLSPSLPPSVFQPEKLTDYEMGIKNRFFNNRLQVNVGAFHYDYKNYQVSYFTPTSLPNTETVYNAITIANAKSGTINGAELENEYALTDNDRLRAAVTYLDATYGEITLPNNPFVNQGNYALGGKTMANSPKFAAQLGYQHTFDLPWGATVTAGVDSHISTKYFVTPELYLPGAQQTSYTNTDLNLRYAAPGDRYSVGFFLKNVEGEAQTTYVFPVYRRLVSDPRTFGFNAEYDF